MQVPDFLQRYPSLLLLIGVAYVARTLAVMASEASPAMAKVLGPFGRRGRRQAAREERDAVLEAMQRDIDRLALRLGESEARESRLRADAIERDAYDEYRDGWLRSVREKLIEQGQTIPPPPLRSREEWRRLRDRQTLRTYQGAYADQED